jgi:hypothetical protein
VLGNTERWFVVNMYIVLCVVVRACGRDVPALARLDVVASRARARTRA